MKNGYSRATSHRYGLRNCSLIRALHSTRVRVSPVASLRLSDQSMPLPNRVHWPDAASMLPEPPLQLVFGGQDFPPFFVARKSRLARSTQRRRSNAFSIYQHDMSQLETIARTDAE